MARKPGEQWRCEACECRLIGALTIKGKVAPIELEPAQDANCLLYRAGTETRVATATGDALAWLTAQGVPLRLNHFATCPERERFARRSAAAE